MFRRLNCKGKILFKAAVIKIFFKECVNSASGKRKQSWEEASSYFCIKLAVVTIQ